MPLSCPLVVGALLEGTGGVVAQIKQVLACRGLHGFGIPIFAEFWQVWLNLVHVWNDRLQKERLDF
jgi:hypothetical protein